MVRVGSTEEQEFEVILHIKSKDATILKFFLNNYNLTVYAIT